MSTRHTARRYQTTWSDLTPWLRQLHEDHRVRVIFELIVYTGSGEVKPAIMMTAVRRSAYFPEHEVKRDWKGIALHDYGSAENAALQMVSLLLLELDNAQAEAEQQSLF